MAYKRSLSSALKGKLKRIKMVVLDVDGVMTDGSIIYGSDGKEYKNFNVHDGYGIFRARRLGLKFSIISGRTSKVTAIRAAKLNIADVYQGNDDKVAVFRKIKSKYKLDYGEVCFIGDDEFDLPLMRKVGLSAAPPDAVDRVLVEVDYITEHAGGRGAVREMIDLILREKRLI